MQYIMTFVWSAIISFYVKLCSKFCTSMYHLILQDGLIMSVPVAMY